MRAVRQLSVLVAMGLLALTPGLVGSGTAHAAGVTYFVVPGGTDTSGTCSTNSPSNAFPSIGDAITCANTDTSTATATASSPDTIQVAAGTYDEHNLAVDAYVTIAGKPGETTVDAQQLGRVLLIDSPYTVSIGGLTITGGLACSSCLVDASGGGVLNSGTLSVTHSTISGNTACSGLCEGHGGGILNSGTLSVTHSTISGNTASACSSCTGEGGGIANASTGTLRVSNSIISGNTACSGGSCTGQGGGILNIGTLSASNSTISGNTACSGGSCTGHGGGIYNNSDSNGVTLTNDTISSNAAYSGTGSGGDGGGIYNTSGTPTLKNDTIKNNMPDDCAGTITC